MVVIIKTLSPKKEISLWLVFSVPSRIGENELQTQLKNKRPLSRVEFREKPCETLLETKQLNKTIKQLHKVEKIINKDKYKSIHWIRYVYLSSGKRCINLKREVMLYIFIFSYRQISLVLLLDCFTR